LLCRLIRTIQRVLLLLGKPRSFLLARRSVRPLPRTIFVQFSRNPHPAHLRTW
jgi:hypothetical protein